MNCENGKIQKKKITCSISNKYEILTSETVKLVKLQLYMCRRLKKLFWPTSAQCADKL